MRNLIADRLIYNLYNSGKKFMTFLISKQTALFIFCTFNTHYGAIIKFGLAATAMVIYR